MARTKQTKPETQGEFQKKMRIDENGETFVETIPGNWIKLDTSNDIKERGNRMKLYYDIALMTIPQLKQRLQELGQNIAGKNLRKKHFVEKLRKALSLSADL